MIPRIIHQTWKTEAIPEKFRAWIRTWRAKNPDWEYRFWTDRELLEFVDRMYPEWLPLYCSWDLGVRRADAARYMLLDHFGGVYADIDAECVTSFEPLHREERAVLSCEPARHWDFARQRGLPYMLFNGVMAGPAGHVLWRDVLQRLKLAGSGESVLDATGPCLLTAAYLELPDRSSVDLHDCRLFNPFDGVDLAAGPTEIPPQTMAIHHWAGTWYKNSTKRGPLQRARLAWHKTIHRARRPKALELADVEAAIPAEVLSRSAPAGDKIAILIPVRDSAANLPHLLDLIGSLDYPKKDISLAFCEGDSKDGTWELLERLTEPLRATYRNIILTRQDVGTTLVHEQRSRPEHQRRRRSALARVRNALIDRGLTDDDDWALWIDSDIWKFPSDIIHRLRETGERIVTPHCVRIPGGMSFDKNAFLMRLEPPDVYYYLAIRDGIYQPLLHRRTGPAFLSDLRAFERVQLDAVGGTMLLVDAALHRGGLRFPEIPYRDLVETEGFGRLAKDLGVTPVGLPQLEVLHVPW